MKRSIASVVDFTNGYGIAYGTTLGRLARLVPFTEAVVSTTLPRGGLQITQPRGTDPVRMRLYVREQHLNDVVAWEAIRRGAPLAISSLLHEGSGPDAESMAATAHRFTREFLQPFNLAHYAAVPLEGPTLDGFPGALHLYREAGDGDFTPAELETLRDVGRELDQANARTHAARGERQGDGPDHRYRQCAFSTEGMIFPDSPPESFDPQLRANLAGLVGDRLARYATTLPETPAQDAPVDGQADEKLTLDEADSPFNGSNADRLLVAGEAGENWTFRLALFPKFPAMNRGRDAPVAVVSLQPECETWSMLRPSDFAADDEIARLIPALQYMQENFTSGSSLAEIARTVHLSPFHFHRRFTDLLGITPKHFLFDCQIAEAKRQLARKERSLVDIARETGFAHQSHFTSRFKQATNLTPTKWRRHLLDSE